ncbi:hypothetical protein [Brevundimonas sp.]|uniref:hypothetical protein n=1 Tax=Brevundimonas sp. TaxID=1871086 RepID=UPI0025F019D4|nr:hypothetical protein [Brevundimonas sp.]
MPEVDIDGYDEQDQSEVFDEDNLDPADAGAPSNEFKTFEEIPDVLDVTHAEGDDDDDYELAADDDQNLEEEDEVVRRDAYDDNDLDDPVDLDALQGVDDQESDEAQLVYVGDVENLKGAQGSAAHFEPRRELSDDDVEALGYGSDEEDQ